MNSRLQRLHPRILWWMIGTLYSCLWDTSRIAQVSSPWTFNLDSSADHGMRAFVWQSLYKWFWNSPFYKLCLRWWLRKLGFGFWLFFAIRCRERHIFVDFGFCAFSFQKERWSQSSFGCKTRWYHGPSRFGWKRLSTDLKTSPSGCQYIFGILHHLRFWGPRDSMWPWCMGTIASHF